MGTTINFITTGLKHMVKSQRCRVSTSDMTVIPGVVCQLLTSCFLIFDSFRCASAFLKNITKLHGYCQWFTVVNELNC